MAVRKFSPILRIIFITTSCIFVQLELIINRSTLNKIHRGDWVIDRRIIHRVQNINDNCDIKIY